MLSFAYKFADPSGPLQLLAIVQLGFWTLYCWWTLRKDERPAE